jgi:hypothetical protein
MQPSWFYASRLLFWAPLPALALLPFAGRANAAQEDEQRRGALRPAAGAEGVVIASEGELLPAKES